MAGHVAQDLASWAQVRRYAVPRRMIELATAARAAGDWRTACEVSNVDIGFDLAEVARGHGRHVAGQLTEDLRHFAPDLARWHLPRVLGGRSTLSTDDRFVLASYGPTPGDAPYLMIRTPTMVDGPQRLRLLFGNTRRSDAAPGPQWWTTSRHLWQASRADELRERCGGSDRTPYFHRDGTPLTAAELPTGPRLDDPAGRTEWLDSRFAAAAAAVDSDALVAAFAAAGIALDLTMPPTDDWQLRGARPAAMLAGLPLALSRLLPELAHLRAGADLWAVPLNWQLRLLFDVSDPAAPAARVDLAYRRRPDRDKMPPAERVPESSWRRLPDLDLLRAGRITPDDLHPLVHDALFPDRRTDVGTAGPRAPQPPTPVRVRCRGEWHEVHAIRSKFAVAHTTEEQQREDALAAFGGTTTGCFAARQAWTGGTGRLPGKLRAQRQDLFHRIQHGDTAAVLALLDAGMDPAVRDGRNRTLLHHLNKLDHETLLPRLLAAGLDLEARDHHDRTPLHVAVGDRGPTSLVRALIDAGAAVDVVDDTGWTLRDLIRRHKRGDLDFLFDALADRADQDGYDWLTEEYEEAEDDEDD